MKDRIAKQRLNVILIVDCSTSMRGERIAQVNGALKDIKRKLVDPKRRKGDIDFFILELIDQIIHQLRKPWIVAGT